MLGKISDGSSTSISDILALLPEVKCSMLFCDEKRQCTLWADSGKRRVEEMREWKSISIKYICFSVSCFLVL